MQSTIMYFRFILIACITSIMKKCMYKSTSDTSDCEWMFSFSEVPLKNMEIESTSVNLYESFNNFFCLSVKWDDEVHKLDIDLLLIMFVYHVEVFNYSNFFFWNVCIHLFLVITAGLFQLNKGNYYTRYIRYISCSKLNET